MTYLTSPPAEGVWKFVKVGDQFRFLDVGCRHSDMVGVNEKAIAAGLIGLEYNFWTLIDDWSMTLEVGANSVVVDKLTKFLGVPRRLRS